jgi:hypothetical protein
MSAPFSVSQTRRLGRPPACSQEVIVHVVELRCQGMSYAKISAELNREGIPTPAGRPVWQRSYVDRLLHTRYAQEIWGQHVNFPLEAASTD